MKASPAKAPSPARVGYFPRGSSIATRVPPDNIESCNSSSAATVLIGTSNDITTWIVFAWIDLAHRTIRVHSAAVVAEYSLPAVSMSFWFCPK